MSEWSIASNVGCYLHNSGAKYEHNTYFLHHRDTQPNDTGKWQKENDYVSET